MVNDKLPPLSVMLLAVPKVSVQGVDVVDVTTRSEARTTGALIKCVPSLTEICAGALLLRLLNVNVLLPLPSACSPRPECPSLEPVCRTVRGASSVTVNAVAVEALITANALSALATPPVHLLESLQFPLTADAQTLGTAVSASVAGLCLLRRR